MRDGHGESAILDFEILFRFVVYDPKNLGNERVYSATHSQKTNAFFNICLVTNYLNSNQIKLLIQNLPIKHL